MIELYFLRLSLLLLKGWERMMLGGILIFLVRVLLGYFNIP